VIGFIKSWSISLHWYKNWKVLKMNDDEKANIIATFKASLDSIFQEKLAQEKWRKKLQKFQARVNLAVTSAPDETSSGPAALDKVYMHIIADKGTISVEPGKLDNADFELAATFELFFTVATGDASAVKALINGSLKASNALLKLNKLLLLNKLLVLERV
jgi:putative sterol carrier protein